MNNLLIMPVIIPLIVGMVLIIFHKNIILQRALSLFALFLSGFIAFVMMNQVREKGIQTLQLGGWEAPFGISFVGDMFSVLLVLTTCIVSSCCLIFAFRSIGEKNEKLYFSSYHSLWSLLFSSLSLLLIKVYSYRVVCVCVCVCFFLFRTNNTS